MENASKALIMAGGVLIGILLISLAVYLFADFGSTSAEINAQNAQKQITQFNSQFTSYEGKEELTIYDIITVIGYAQENNKFYEDSEEYKIIVKLENSQVQGWTEENKIQKIEDEQISINLPTYRCRIEGYHENGRVSIISFAKN